MVDPIVWSKCNLVVCGCCSRYEVGRKKARNKVTAERDKLKHQVKREMKVDFKCNYNNIFFYIYSDIVYNGART